MVVQGDITDYSSVVEVSQGATVVIHTASLVDVWHRVPESVIEAVNVKGMETGRWNGIGWGRKKKGRKFL